MTRNVDVDSGPPPRRAGAHRAPARSGNRPRRGRFVAATAAIALVYVSVGGVSLATSTSSTPSNYSALPATPLVTKTLTANQSATVQVGGVHSVPTNATSVQLSVVISGTTAAGGLSVYALGDGKPAQPTIVWTAGQSVTESVVVGIGTSGQIRLSNDAGSVQAHLVVVGFYVPTGPVNPFTNTVIVGGAGSPAANGTALLSAVNTFGVKLVRLDPGTYDLGTQSLALPTGLALEGAGVQSLVFSSAASVMSMADATTLGDVLVENSDPNGVGVTVSTGARARIDGLEVDPFDNSAASPVGVDDEGGTLTMQDSRIDVSGSGLIVGLYVSSSGTATVSDTTIEASGANATSVEAVSSASPSLDLIGDTIRAGSNVGASTQVLTISNSGNNAVRNSTVTAAGQGTFTIADFTKAGGQSQLTGSDFGAGGSNGTVAGLYNAGRVYADTTTFAGSGVATSYGIDVASGGATTVQESQIQGQTFSIDRGGSNTQVGGSYVAQGTTGTGTISCVDDYNAGYVATNANCG